MRAILLTVISHLPVTQRLSQLSDQLSRYLSACIQVTPPLFFFNLIMALKYKSSDSGNLDVSKPRRKVLHLTEKVKVLNKGEKKKSYTEVAKIHIKNKSSVVKL